MDQIKSRSNGLSDPYKQPPMLRFRSFHDRHFSDAQRQTFFAGIASAPMAWSSQNSYNGYEYKYGAVPTAYDTMTDFSSYQELIHEHENVEKEEKESFDSLDEEQVQNTSLDAKSDNNDFQASPLSKEAIEIFEFSRRFRQEKAAAALLEQERLKKRRKKRRKLTKLGFAIDEGDSGAESDININNTSDHGPAELEQQGGGNSKEVDDSDDDSDSNDSDDGHDSVYEEPSPMDNSFINSKSHRTEKLRERLYGQCPEIWTIEMLERLVNRSYIDSLGPQISPIATGTSREIKRQRSKSDNSQPIDRQKQVVYWPSMPLRC
ncbi:hypothetical protein BX616_003502 [Lobosporangium transversale]|nr:hypothetical protein BX616_003502 [Lobosporangium transversale]